MMTTPLSSPWWISNQYDRPAPRASDFRATAGLARPGNHVEANVELEKITSGHREHPYVLEVRWQLYAAAKNWDAALDIASMMVQLLPENPFGWIHRSPS
jgi:hypothetical protein